jgi:hypothetical protein
MSGTCLCSPMCLAHGYLFLQSRLMQLLNPCSYTNGLHLWVRISLVDFKGFDKRKYYGSTVIPLSHHRAGSYTKQTYNVTCDRQQTLMFPPFSLLHLSHKKSRSKIHSGQGCHTLLWECHIPCQMLTSSLHKFSEHLPRLWFFYNCLLLACFAYRLGCATTSHVLPSTTNFEISSMFTHGLHMRSTIHRL